LVSASSLVIGSLIATWLNVSLRAIGLIMAFGAGVLISAVAFDLLEEAAESSATAWQSGASSPAVRSSSVATG
jgi:zinc transporter, ZIP family